MDQTAQTGTKKPSAKRTSIPPWSKQIMGTKSATSTGASTPNSNHKPTMPKYQNHHHPSSSAPPEPAYITSDIAPASVSLEAPASMGHHIPIASQTPPVNTQQQTGQKKPLVRKQPLVNMADRQSIRQLQFEWEAAKRASGSASASPARTPGVRESRSPSVRNGEGGSPAGNQPAGSPAVVESPVPLPDYATSQKRTAAQISSSEGTNSTQSAPPPKRHQPDGAMTGPEMVYVTVLKKHMSTIPHVGNRLFCESQDEYGNWKIIQGLIIPKGYSLLDPAIYQVARWACPVRECRRRMEGLEALAAHMSACHSGKAFNDNQDGTISDVSPYYYAHGPDRFRPPVVIGRLTLPVTAPPPAAPILATWNEVGVRPKQVKQVREALMAESAKPVESVEPVEPGRHITPQVVSDHAQPALQNNSQAGAHISQSSRHHTSQASTDRAQPARQNTTQSSVDRAHPARHHNPQASADHAQPALKTNYKVSADRSQPAPQNTPAVGADYVQPALQNNSKASATHVEPTFPTNFLADADPSDPIQYLNGFLSAKQRDITREDVRFMAQLPRLRGLPNSWLEYHQSEELDNDHYACALAYVVGESVTDNSQCRHKDRQPDSSRYRLSDECIRLPPSMTFSAKQIFSSTRTCVGCKYWSHLQRRPNPCEWNPANPSKAKSVEKSKAEPERASSPVPSEDSGSDSLAFGRTIGREERQLRAKKGSPAARSSSSTEPDDADPDMESWEFAPGKVLDESRKETVAFSTSYLTSSQPIIIADDIGFNRIRLPPGGTHRWAAKNGQLRYCEVIAGKVEVKVDEQSISIGAGGLFVIRPGKSCRASNRRYAEAVLSCHTNSDYSYI